MAGADAELLGRQLRELVALHDGLRALTSTLDLPEILRTVLARIRALAAAEALSLLLYDPERNELVFAATETLREGALTDVTSVAAGDGATDMPSRIVVPLRQGDRVAGQVVVDGPLGASAFDAEARRRLAKLAETLAAECSEKLAQDAEALHRVFGRVAAAVPSRATTLTLYDAQGRALVFRTSHALEPGVIDGVRMPADRGIAGWVAQHREPLRLTDASTDPRHDPTLARRTGLVPRSMLCVPLLHRERLLGVIQVINRLDGGVFTEDELRLVRGLADHAAIAIANAQLYREVEVASLTDDLTGLGNTRAFHRVLPPLLVGRPPVSLLVLDLDHLKEVVDTHGHLVGSRAIATVGRLIAEQLRPGDVAARFGGDEFVVVLPSTETEAARGVAEHIRAAVAECSRPDGLDVDITTLTASIGIATAPPLAADPDVLFRAADGAMYAIKRARRDGVWVADAGPPPRRPA
jgi:diguanylate cyclase (GGDEF)-like protein